MNNDILSIIIDAALDEAKLTQSVNTQLSRISRKINKLDIDFGFDTKEFQKMAQQVTEIQKKIASQSGKFFNVDEANKSKVVIFGSIDEAVKKYEELGQVSKRVKMNPLTKEVEDFTLSIKKADGIVEKLKFNLQYLTDGTNLQKVFSLSSQGVKDNSAKIREEVLQKEQKINQTIEKRKSSIDAENEKMAHRLKMYQDEAKISADNLKRKYGNNINVTELDGYLRRVQALNAQTPQLKNKMDELDLSLKRIAASANASGSRVASMGEKITAAFERIPIYATAMAAFYTPLRAFQTGIKNIYELDTALTKLRKVTDETNSTYRELVGNSNEIASSLGALTVDVVSATTEWARLGYTIKQAQTLAKETTIYANVGDMGAEDASKSLISTIKGFGIAVDEEGRNIRKVVDIFNEVGNNFAISSSGIGEALRRSAASLSAAGNSIEESVALVTAANTTLQDPASVGTALKTVSMRIRGISDDGEDLSKLVPTLEAKFNSLGLSLKKDENTFKSTYEILKDLAELKVKGMTDFQLAEITELVAGKRQGNIISSLLDNWKDAEGALQSALQSTGSAAKENNAYLDSMQAKLAQLKNEIVGFWSDAISSDSLKGLIDAGTSLIQVFGDVTNSVGLLPTVVGLATTSFILFSKSGLTPLYTALTTIPMKLSLLKLELRSVAASSGIATAGVKALQVSLMALGKSVLPIAIITGLTYGITKLYEAHQKNKEIQKEIDEQNKVIADSWLTQKKNVTELIGEFVELDKVTNNGKLFSNVEQELRYKEVVEQLSTLMPNLVASIDEKGNKHLKNVEAMKQEIAYAEKLAGIEQKQRVIDAEDTFKSQLEGLDELEEKILTLQSQMVMGGKFVSSGYGAAFIPYSESELNKMEYQIISLQQQVSTSKSLIEDEISSLIKNILSINEITIDDNIEKSINDIVGSLDTKGLDKSELVEKSNAIASFVQSLNSLADVQSVGQGAKVSEDIKRIGLAIGFTESQISSLTREYLNFSNVQETVSQDIKSFEQIISEMNSQYKDSEKTVENLNKLLELNAEKKSISADEAQKMVDADASMIAMFKVENGQIKLNIEAIVNKREAELKAFDAIETARKNDLFNANSALIEKLNTHGLEIESIEDLTGAYQKLDEIYADRLNNAATYSEAIGIAAQMESDKAALGSFMEKVDELKRRAELARAALKTTGTSSTKDKTSKSKDEPRIQEVIDARINAINALADEQAKLNEVLSREIEISSQSGKYTDSIKQANKLFEGQRASVDKLTDANRKLLAERRKLEESNKSLKMSEWLDANGEATEKFIKQFNSLKTGSAQTELQKLFNEYQKLTKAIEDNKNAVTELFDEMASTIPRILTFIQSASEAITSKSNRKIGLLGNINTQDEKDKLAEYTKEIVDALKTESSKIFSEIDRLNKIIVDPKTTSALKEAALQALEEYKNAANEVNLELVQQSESLGQQQAEAMIFGFNKRIEDLEYEKSLLTNSDADQEIAKKIGEEIAKIRLSAQEILNKEILDLEAQYAASSSQAEKMTLKTKLEYLRDYTKSAQAELVKSYNQQVDDREKSAEKIVSNYKKMLEKQRDLELKVYDDIMSAEDERHKKKIENLDAEYKKNEDIINQQLKAMSRSNEKDDYERDLQKLTSERETIQQKYNTKLKDDSWEAKAARKELLEQLAKIDEEIADKQRERGRTTARQTLEDALSDHKNYIDDLKEQENDGYNNTKKKLEEQKKLLDTHWKSVLENEQTFSKLKNDLMSNDVQVVKDTLSTMKAEYDGFFTYLKGQASTLGTMFGTINSNFQTDYNDLNKYSSQPTQNVSNNSSNMNNSVLSAWNDYLNNKREWEKLNAQLKGSSVSSSQAESIKKKMSELKEANNKYREKFQFPDAHISVLEKMAAPIFSAETGGMTPAWGKGGKLLMAHEKEMILNKQDTSNLIKAVDITRTITDYMKRFNVQAGDSSTVGTVIENMTLQFNGNYDKRDGNNVFKDLQRALNANGVTI